MKAFILTTFLLILPIDKESFGVESISVYFNKTKIGFWNIYIKTPEKVIVDFKSNTDTLFFKGYSDVGNLDGTIIKVKHSGKVILNLTRISKSGILRNDTIMIKNAPGEKQSFFLDRVVTFTATKRTFKKLHKGLTYNVFIQRRVFEDTSDTHIFDILLK